MYDSSYCRKLTSTLVKHSINELFYTGNVATGSMIITKEVVDSLGVDRASIWTYNSDRDGIVCDKIYIKSTGLFHEGLQLFERDYPEYFSYLNGDEPIIADDAESHPATSCFLNSYLIPLGIKSMLNVPIWHRGRIIGVFCIESLTTRSWKTEEIHFAQILSSLYSFSYSVKESNKLISIIEGKESQLSNRMDAINRSNAVIEFSLDGIIMYANSAFLKTMGYNSEELVGKHHSIFVVDEEKGSESYANFWKTLKAGNYFSGDIVRKKKDGTLVYLRATYNPIIGEDGKPYSVMKIATDITQSVNQQMEIEKKNAYLEHAAKILRHDMHSGINTYIPRGISSLERRLTPELMKQCKLDMPFRLLKEGLSHTQKVYKGVYEFTNLVKKDTILETQELNLKSILADYLRSTSYSDSVIIEDLGISQVNESLFCTAIDNLIRNGLKYNDNSTKCVKIYKTENVINVEDNGRGMTQEDFDNLSKPYARKKDQVESGSGLGLNICVAILNEHEFDVSCKKSKSGGTIISIKIK